MKSTEEIQNRIDFYRAQWELSANEGLWNAAAIYQNQIAALEWVLGVAE